MPTFEVDVEGKTYEVDAPDTNTAWAWAYTTHRQQFGMKPAAPPEKTGMLRAAADIPVQVGRGVAVGVKALSDVFGADNPVSRAASGVEDYLGGLLSAQAKNDQTEIARIMKEAQDKGVGEQVVAAVKAFSTAPVDMLSQALGTAVPVIAGGLAGSIARLGAAGVGAIGTGVGAAMGAGTVKGQIYDAVKQELLENKVPEAEAEKRAQEAQAYGGKNLDQILMGAGIGAAEAAFGAERILTGLLRKGAVKPSALPAKYRIPTAAGMEAVPEMAQAAQEQVAQNIALQREGYDVPTMRGVVGQAALEGLAGAGLGAITGAAQRTAPEAKITKKAETPEGKVAGRTTVVTDEETAARLREEQAAEPQQAEAEAPKPVTGEAGIVRPEEETPISREVTKAAEPEVAPPVAPETAAPELAPPMPSAEHATLEAVKPDALWNQFNDDPDQGRFLPFKKLTKGRQREWDAAVAAGTADMDTYLQIAGAQLVAEQAREKAKLDKILEASAATSRKRLVEAGVIEPSVTEVSPEPGIAEDRQRAEPVVEAAAPEPVVTEAEAAKPEEVAPEAEAVPQAEISKPAEPQLVQQKEPKTAIAEAPDTLTDDEFDQYEREQIQEASSRLSAGDYAAPRPATFVRPGMRSKVDEAMDRAKQNAYKKAVREFLQAPLTAKPPTGKSEGIDYSIYDAVDGLTDVEPQRIETKAPVAKSFQNKLEVLFKYVVPSKDIRYYLTRVMLDPEKSRMVATDGKSLVVIEDESVKQNAPERPLGVTRDKAILVDKDGTWATADDGRPMEAIYPDVDKVIPKTDRTDAVSYNTDDFVAYAKGVEKSNKFVKTDLPLVIQIFNKQNAFDVERLVSLGEVFRRLGYKNFVVTLPNDPLDGRLMATSPDGKVKQIVMSRKYGETTGEIKRRFYKPYEPVAIKKSLRAAPAQQVTDFEQTLRTALNKFGLKDVGVKLVEGMREEGSYAQQLIQIAADSANPIRTLRHEAIHALRELGFFTPQQWQSLSKVAKDKWIDQYLKQRNVDGKPLKAGEESRYDAYMREYNGDMEKITEEAVADAFADFDATKPPPGLMASLLTRLRNLFQAIKSALTKVESPEQIFGKVERGELAAGAAEMKGEAKSLRDRATANFLRWFGDSKVVDEKGEPLVVYHGTRASFDKFELSKAFQDEYGQGFYFTEYPDVASKYAERESGNVMPVYLSIKNPAIVRGAFADGDLYKLAGAERRSQLTERLIAKGYDGVIREQRGGKLEIVAFRPEQIKSATGNNGEYSLTDADIRKSLRKEEPKLTPTTAGQSALDTINQLGMGVKEPEKNLYQKAKDTFKQMRESPAGTKAEIKEAVRKFFANTESKVFSPDARWDSDIKNGLRKDMKPIEDIIGASLLVSQSQAVGPDAVATRAMLIGGAKYDAEVMKWVAYENKDANEIVKAKVLDDIAAKYGLTREEASQVAHTYLVAANYEGILKRNAKLEERIKELQQEGKKDEADDLQAALVFVSEDQAAMVEPGKAIANSIPEVKKITEIWNEQRRMVKDAMVFGGLWTPEYADALMDNAAYVPFYREKQIEADEGPRVFMRGLQVKAKEQKLKGSKTAVNDVFENMALWQQYAINRAIRNHKMVQSIDVGKTIQAGDRKMAEQVSEPKRGMNVVRLWREGKQEFYEVADPYYVEAFQSLGAVYIEPIKYFTAISNILRKTVVMYPLFSIGQLTQDSVAAIFASGLKPQYAFKIPFLAVQEFIKTMKGWSTTHDELVKYGAVGVRDFNANVAKEDAEITANIKAPKGTAGKIKYMLERIAMSADNAVRQATYIAAQDAGLSKAEALEKAFEIINFRRRGSSKLLQLMGQTVPFFYAYLSAQRVAYKTLTLSGISPTERKAALETLAQTTAAVMALSFLYAMANGDDEEYKKTPATVRDRSLIIPGSGGVRIPLRPDFFLFPKVIAEHTYQLITDEGYSDGAKFRKSMADLFANATLSPNPVPQLIKPTLEAVINYSFFDGKPIVGFFEQNKEAGRQFNESTSEFAKLLGRFGASPQMVDHLVRGYFGSVGGLALWGTNFFIEGEPGVPRPELTAHDMVTTLPGVGAFKQKPTENALKVDFYELRDAIAKAKNTYDDMKVRSPEGLEAFLQDEKNLARLAMDKQITKIGDHLSKIRRAIQQVAAAPESRMSASEKQERIKELRDVEMELLKAVDVKAMRAQAKL